MPVQAFESSHGKVDHQGGGLLGSRGEEVGCVQLEQFSAVLCMMVQMVVQVKMEQVSNSLNLALHHITNSVEFLFGPRKLL